MASLQLQWLGMKIYLRAQAEILDAFANALHWWTPLVPCESEPGLELEISRRGMVFDIYDSGQRFSVSSTASGAIGEAINRLLPWMSSQACGIRVFHSGVVAREDQAILLPGSSHCGKSTLVAELARLGYAYFSDEAAILDSQGWLHPFPIPVQYRSSQEQTSWLDPREQGWEIGASAVRPGLILFCQYQAGRKPRLKQLGAAQSMAQCWRHMVSRKPDWSHDRIYLEHLTKAKSFEVVRGEADLFANFLQKMLPEVA